MPSDGRKIVRRKVRPVTAGRYRARFEILSQICDLLETQANVTKTSVMYSVSLSFGQRNEYLRLLEAHGLATWLGRGKGRTLRITARGRTWNRLQKKAMRYLEEGAKQKR